MWVFGYGSLLWNPEFNPVESVRADLPGYTRNFCCLLYTSDAADE